MWNVLSSWKDEAFRQNVAFIFLEERQNFFFLKQDELVSLQMSLKKILSTCLSS